MVEKLINKLRLAAEASGAIFIIAYFFGFVIVNLHLAQYGFYDFSFVRLKYITAGILYLFLLCSYVFLLFVIYKIYTKRVRGIVKSNKDLAHKIANVGIFIGSLIIWLFILWGIWGMINPVLPNRDFIGRIISTEIIFHMRGDMIIWLATSLFMSIFCLRILKIRKTLEAYFSSIEGTYYVFGILTIFLISISFFSLFVYPYIPQYLGGGKTLNVELIFKKDFDLIDLGQLPSNKINAKLIYQSPNNLLIETNSSTFSFKPEDVSAIKYIDSIHTRLEQIGGQIK